MGVVVTEGVACAGTASPEQIAMAAMAVLAPATAIVMRMSEMWVGLRIM